MFSIVFVKGWEGITADVDAAATPPLLFHNHGKQTTECIPGPKSFKVIAL